jgi:hypothetical protein
MRPTTHALTWTLLLALCCAPLQLSAQPHATRGPALNWVRMQGADDCIAAVELADRVEARLGRRVFTRVNDAVLVIEGRVGPAADGGFSAVLRVSDPDGTLYGVRELNSPNPDCRALDEVVALIIAITIRPDGSTGITLPAAVAAELDALLAGEPNTLDPAAFPPPAATMSPPPPAAEHESPQPAAAWFTAAELTIGITTGLQPSLAAYASLRASLRHAALGVVSVSGLLSIPQQQIGLDGEGALQHRFYGFGLGLCMPTFPLGSSAIGLCAEGRVGSLRVAPRGFATQQKSSGLWAEVAPRALLRVHLLGPAYAVLALALPIRLRVPEFRYTERSGEARVALAPARLGLEGELGIGLEF